MASTASSSIDPCDDRRSAKVASSLPFRTAFHSYGAIPTTKADDDDDDLQHVHLSRSHESVVAVRAEKGRLIPTERGEARSAKRRQLNRSASETHPLRGEESVNLEGDDASPGQRTVVVVSREGPVEAHRVSNNYMFGLKKWKSHVTERPLEQRSAVVQNLYAEPRRLRRVRSTVKIGNIIYFLLFGWWSALVYVVIAGVMALTIIGWPMARRCVQLAVYMLWPFGRFVHTPSHFNPSESSPLQARRSQARQTSVPVAIPNGSVRSSELDGDGETPAGNTADTEERDLLTNISGSYDSLPDHETAPLAQPGTPQDYLSQLPPPGLPVTSSRWKTPSFWVWLIFGAPIAVPMHIVIASVAWFLVVLIPVAKMNFILLRRVLFEPPHSVCINDSSQTPHFFKRESEVRLCIYEAVNLYFYKYSVDGMNVVLVNLLPFVVLSLVTGYVDTDNKYTSDSTKFGVALVSIIPLAYYIGLAITSIAAQSTYAVGAVLNATFGSIVELTLYVSMLLKGHNGPSSECYEDLVKSALTGTLLATMLFIPGLCMIIGGLKHQEQRFNWRSAGVSSSLLFVSVAGCFAPTLFAKAYGGVSESMSCQECYREKDSNGTESFNCTKCSTDEAGSMFAANQKVLDLSYICATLLPLAYILGLLFTLKTHRYIYSEPTHHNDDQFAVKKSGDHGHSAHWSRPKGLLILLVATVLMSLLADQVTEHIHPVLKSSGISSEFIGVTLLAIVPNLPEIVNGVQFALNNIISLSIEVGSSIAVQVCLLQIPVLVWFDLVHPIGFHLVFTDTQLWSVLFGVIVMNYIFMDGKSDYFQGFILFIVYAILVSVFYFVPSPSATC